MCSVSGKGCQSTSSPEIEFDDRCPHWGEPTSLSLMGPAAGLLLQKTRCFGNVETKQGSWRSKDLSYLLNCDTDPWVTKLRSYLPSCSLNILTRFPLILWASSSINWPRSYLKIKKKKKQKKRSPVDHFSRWRPRRECKRPRKFVEN